MRALTDPRCVIPPLGSPWSTSNRLLDHVPTFGYALVGGWGVPGVVRLGWVPGRGIPVYYPAGRCKGPGGPLLVLPGPNPCHIPGSASTRATPGPSRPLRTPLAPRTQIRPPRPITARFRVIYPKVSLKTGVSPGKRHEAWHSPCFKNPL